MEDENLEILSHIIDDVTILGVKCDVTAITGKTVEEAYQKATTDGAKKILLLFDKENYINSGGIASLILIASQSKKREQTVAIAGISDHFHKIFDMVGLSKYAKVYPSKELALEGF